MTNEEKMAEKVAQQIRNRIRKTVNDFADVLWEAFEDGKADKHNATDALALKAIVIDNAATILWERSDHIFKQLNS